ncbi:MAG: tRNA (adenosine(37)-N6)-dimethylallyltransferase MiaA [Firmicutes bacterium]|nr:tRNA (adenosine(37)-N6)-dimethylallyltransferase MiaA [Bacillota bacterium]
MVSERPRVGAIVGPTAVGKSELAVEVAERVGAEILSADSTAVYRGMDIGTDKPPPEVRRRVPHHLIDLVDPDEPFHVVRYCEEAARAVREVLARGRRPLFVGGTGLYVRAATLGYRFNPAPPDPRLRRALWELAEREGPVAVHRRLAAVDAEAARRIDPHNTRRVIRALEVHAQTGVPFSRWLREGAEPPYERLVVGLTRARAHLYARVEERVHRELRDGLVEEVRRLLERYPPDLPAFQALGYKEVIGHLQGRYGYEEMVALLVRNTRRFAKRQYTWFRREPGIVWLDLDRVEEPAALLAGWFRAFFEEGRRPAPVHPQSDP